jgi:hypothetical protein
VADFGVPLAGDGKVGGDAGRCGSTGCRFGEDGWTWAGNVGLEGGVWDAVPRIRRARFGLVGWLVDFRQELAGAVADFGVPLAGDGKVGGDAGRCGSTGCRFGEDGWTWAGNVGGGKVGCGMPCLEYGGPGLVGWLVDFRQELAGPVADLLAAARSRITLPSFI